MSKSLKRVIAALEIAGITEKPREMPGETRTAQQAADELGCQVAQIAISIIFHGQASDQMLLFITSGANLVCPDMASDVAGEALGKADAGLIRARTGFAIGGVSPVGHLTEPRVFFDPHLMEFPQIWAAAGTPRHLFGVSPANLRKITSAELAEFTKYTALIPPLKGVLTPFNFAPPKNVKFIHIRS